MITRSVERFLKSHGVKPGASLLVGYSGGPDSTCLLAIVRGLAARYDFRIAAAYLEHGIRPHDEREGELRHVRETAAALGVSLFIKAVPEGELQKTARREKISLEEAARAERKKFFRETGKRHGFDYLLLGHTLDDQIETVLLRLFQGSGFAGLKGISARRGWILRPLLGVSRERINAYLHAENLSSVTDSTNQKTVFLRNQIRHLLVPVLTRIFPGLGRSLGALTRKAGLIHQYVTMETARRLRWQKDAGGARIPAGRFFNAPPALRMYSLYRQYEEIMKGKPARSKKALPFRFIKPLLSEKTPVPEKIDLTGYGVRLRGEGETLFLTRDIVSNEKIGYVINVNQGDPVSLFGRRYRFVSMNAVRDTDDVICAFDAQKVVSPFIIRSWRAGDRIVLDYGKKRLKKLFSDWKIGKGEKKSIPLIVDGEGILAVLGTFAGKKNIIRFDAAQYCCHNPENTLVFCHIVSQ